MTAVQAILTETELATWLTEQVGPEIRNDYDTARLLLATFDLAAKEGTSLNNPHQIAGCIASTPSTNGPFGPVDTVQAAGTLHEAYRITRKPTDRPFVLITAPIVVSRHQCPFCRRFTRADVKQVTDHMTRCWQNPGLRCCKTCTHHQDGSHPEDDESCIHPDGPEYEEYRFPVLHCPLWQPKEA